MEPNERRVYNPWEYEDFEDQGDLDFHSYMEELANSWVRQVFPEVGDDMCSIEKLHVNVYPPSWLSPVIGIA